MPGYALQILSSVSSLYSSILTSIFRRVSSLFVPFPTEYFFYFIISKICPNLPLIHKYCLFSTSFLNFTSIIFLLDCSIGYKA